MKDLTIIVDLSPEDQNLLFENGIDIVSALREQDLQVQRAPLPPGVPVADGRKELMLTILAVGVTTTLVATGIAKILDALGRNKKTLVTECELLPVLDSSGKAVLASGQPVLYWSEKKRLIEATQAAEDKSTSSLEGVAGPLLLKFTHSNK